MANNHQIVGKPLKQFQPNEKGNLFHGTDNDSWYGKIEIDARKEIGNPQPNSHAQSVWECSSSAKCWLAFIIIY